MEHYFSIFNQVLSPITPGPSSSNTSGPVRIGYSCNEIIGGIPKEAVIEFSKDGAFPSTYIGMKSDIAFINGLLGKLQTDPEFKLAYECSDRENMKVEFRIVDDFKADCMEAARLILTTKDNERYTILGDSTGGGTFKIREINGCNVDITGDSYELLVFYDIKSNYSKAIKDILNELKDINGYNISITGDMCILEIKSPSPFKLDNLDILKDKKFVKKYRVLNPLHPVVFNRNNKPPFNSMRGMIDYCFEHNKSPSEAAFDYECEISGWSREAVYDYASNLLSIIENSIIEGMKGDFSIEGIVSPKAQMLKDYFNSEMAIDMGYLKEAVPMAAAVMEYSNSSGNIVCLPTGGSSGIIPGILFGAKKQLNLSNKDLIDGLMVAGIVGVLMSEDNNFNGGEYGCQAEVGCASSMAAGALVQLLGGNAQQVFDAASMALQCHMGLLCDPVGGFVQVPCIARNISGTAISAISANTVLAGFDVVVPFDEVVHAMIDLGKRLPPHMKGCQGSGICISKTAKRIRDTGTGRDH